MSPYKSPALDYFEWQQPVLDRLNTPPGGEAKGDRYLIITGTDAWLGEDGNIATYNGAGWDFTDKKKGMVVYVMDENVLYLYIAAWAVYGGGDVTAGANLTDLAVVRGDGGAKGVKTSTALISDAGEMTNPSQPCFLANNSVKDEEVTGDGTIYKVDFDNVITDQGGNFAADEFTAPVDGNYLLTTVVYLDELNVDTYDLVVLTIVTSNRSYTVWRSSDLLEGTGGTLIIGGSIIADMDANDTAYVTIAVTGGTKSIDIQDPNTYFSGALIC